MTDLSTIISIFTSLSIGAWKIPSLDIKIVEPINYPFGHTAYMGSMYLTVLLTMVRYLAVCWKKHFTIKETKILIASVILFVIIYNLPKWMIWEWKTNQNGVKEVKPTELACDPTFLRLYYVGGNGLFLFILPTLTLIISNILMLKEVTNCRYSKVHKSKRY